MVDEVRKKFGVPLVSQVGEPFKQFSIPEINSGPYMYVSSIIFARRQCLYLA